MARTCFSTVPSATHSRFLPPDRPGSGANTADQASAIGITDRERSVLRLLADGWETGEIAKELCYSNRTVTSVVHDITQRFRRRNRAHAVAYALRAGML